MKTLTWFFDLDNTLHDASFAIFGTINGTISDYLRRHLAVDEADADRLRVHYWQRYGATLLGLIKHHAVDPHHFLRETHAFAHSPDFATMVRAERGMTQLFRRLPGRKVLLTNAPASYAAAVLRQIGLHRQFTQPHGRRYAIEQMRVHRHFRPKPSRAMLRMLLAKENVAPSRAVLLDDSAANLRSARVVGMRTVLVNGLALPTGLMPFGSGKKSRPRYVGLQVKSVGQLLRRRRFLR